MATAEVLSAIAGYLVITSDDPREAESAMRWMLGGFGGTTWGLVPIPGAAVLLGTVTLLGVSRPLNLLPAGRRRPPPWG
ncbi:iron chelate uptake ABC transporter family permease subunit [Nonomuraea sp. NPDC050643]|uniref:iron chelate uptake ABC transporter family permease subunit n=1 Tax=Nonomuraea sp. NPDC050643 TaxID=3155660 RepID=UPI0033C7F137